MKITSKLAYSQLIINRQRTIWTLIGIILSTALISVVCNLVASGTASTAFLTGDSAQRGMLFTLLLVPATFVIAIIILMAVTVISNGFRVSAEERTVQFGILKSVGATKKQIAATVMYESVWLSAVGIPLGIIWGLFLSFACVQVANYFLSDLNSLTQVMIQEFSIQVTYVIAWQALLASGIISFITVLISARKPANLAAKLTAIDSIKANLVFIKREEVRINPLVHKFFGFEGVLAAKSLKRSRRNFRASMLSLIIAVVMFVTVSGILMAVGKLEDLTAGFTDATVIVDYSSSRTRRNPETGEWEDYIVAPINSTTIDIITERLKEHDNTNVRGSGGNNIIYSAIVPKEMITSEMMEIIKNKYPDEQPQYELSTSIITVDPEYYAILAERAGVPMGSNILLNHYAINDKGNVVIFEPLIFQNQTLQLVHMYDGITEVEIHGMLTVEQLPTEFIPINPAASVAVSLIVPYADMRDATWLATPDNIEGFMEHAHIVMEEMYPHFNDGEYMGEGFSIRIYEMKDYVRVMNLGIGMATVFTYSFTIALTIIGLTSVISTLSTNVRMRSREFAVLQSVGMTYDGLKHMLNLESIMCSSKAITFGVPIGIILTYLIHLPIRTQFPIPYQLPWLAIIQCIVGVFAITWVTMRFSVSHLRKKNIIENIRRE